MELHPTRPSRNRVIQRRIGESLGGFAENPQMRLRTKKAPSSIHVGAQQTPSESNRARRVWSPLRQPWDIGAYHQ